MALTDKELYDILYKENMALRKLCTQLAYHDSGRMIEKLISIAVADKVEAYEFKVKLEKAGIDHDTN